jgi:hypothetical protein
MVTLLIGSGDEDVAKNAMLPFDGVSVTVVVALSGSVTTMSMGSCAVSSTYVSCALIFVALGPSFVAVPVTAFVPLTDSAPSETFVAIVKLLLRGRCFVRGGLSFRSTLRKALLQLDSLVPRLIQFDPSSLQLTAQVSYTLL